MKRLKKYIKQCKELTEMQKLFLLAAIEMRKNETRVL